MTSRLSDAWQPTEEDRRRELTTSIIFSANRTLWRHRGKGDWRDTPLTELERQLDEEVAELKAAIRGNGSPRVEMGDVAVSAAMLADAWEHQRRRGAARGEGAS